MSNQFWTNTPNIIDGTKSRADAHNDKHAGIEEGFNKVEAEFDKTPKLPDTFTGNSQIPEVTVEQRILFINATGNMDLYPLSDIIQAEANAEQSANDAAGSETAAGQSATAASNSASAASGSATNASNSASAASNSETAAGQSATAASNSASAASTSAGQADTARINAESARDSAQTHANNASNSASAASTSEGNASTSASNANTSANNAAISESNTQSIFDDFDARYLGAKSSAPSTDNDGGALVEGQMYFNTTAGRLYIRFDGAWITAAEPSSGPVDAASLEGYTSAAFARKAATQTISAAWTFTATPNIRGWSVGPALLQYGGAADIGTTSGDLDLTPAGNLRIKGNIAWHTGNDGSGSGLDADKLDGQHASAFAAASHSHGYLPLSGGTITSNLTVNGVLSVRNAIDLADNDILRFGSGDDCELFCNGSHMYMDLNGGIGNFYIRDGSTTRFTFDDSGILTCSNVTITSDERAKTDIMPIAGALEKLEGLIGVDFTMKDTGQRSTGLIAQDVLAVKPEAVHEGEDGMLSVGYGNLVGLLVSAINELREEVEELKYASAE